MNIEMVDTFNQGTQIKVIGVGGGGGNAVEHMIRQEIQGVEFLCANTDQQALGRSSAHLQIPLGASGLGAGSKPAVGRQTAEESEDRLRAALEGANLIFITAGMGGGTGTGAAPVIARIAKDMGILTVAVVTKPFEFEGTSRMKAAESGLAELEANVDSLIVVQNEKLYEVYGDDMLLDELYAKADDVLKSAVSGIIDVIRGEGMVNVDFNDLKTIMQEPGKAIMGTALATGPDRAIKAADAAMACPLLDGVDVKGAKGMLVLFAASRKNLKGSEAKAASLHVRSKADPDVEFKYGLTFDESLGDGMRVTVIATGLQAQTARRNVPLSVISTQPQSMLRTGTDNQPAYVGSNPVGGMLPTRPSSAVFGSRQSSAMAAAGVDDYEVPAFLRKQAD
ncbi:cell division protein FtsZ [Amphibiibacter pelophylacis]|uniref:Cell division protein FtsZ n=1 Tax=Amphibiibacter pelophylacis TaxID=1799477 RepID=A0ACC6P5D9_9BURK